MVQDKYREEGSVCPIGFKATQNYMLSDVTKLFSIAVIQEMNKSYV